MAEALLLLEVVFEEEGSEDSAPLLVDATAAADFPPLNPPGDMPIDADEEEAAWVSTDSSNSGSERSTASS